MFSMLRRAASLVPPQAGPLKNGLYATAARHFTKRKEGLWHRTWCWAGAVVVVARLTLAQHYEAREFPTPLIVEKTGENLMNDPLFNKGTAFPYSERDRLGLRGLLPPRQFSAELQIMRVLARLGDCHSDLEKNTMLNSLQDRNETLFYRVLMDNIEELAPIIYTPTVGEACVQHGRHFRRPRGMFFSPYDRNNMHAMVYNWPAEDVDVIVVTDGSRILGLGDLGCHGMPIPVGKLALYVAAGGIHPDRVLPVQLDLGTDNQELLKDPFYLGLQRPRITGREYYEYIDEFMHAVTSRWPKVLVQFEDFSNRTAEPLLTKYRDQYLCFNDDIQGTGTVTLAGILCALRKLGLDYSELVNQRIVCLGAGSAGLGVVNSLAYGMTQEGTTPEAAAKQFWMVDQFGLLGEERPSLYSSQRQFARSDMKDGTELLDVVKKVKPTILLGLSGAGGAFTEEVVKEMAKHCERPIIFPLSNPTSKAECTFEQAVHWTEGRVVFASGSPFEPLEYNGKTYLPSQGNNMYIFPGVGLGAVVCEAAHISDSMLYTAARALASSVTHPELASGRIYPSLQNIRKVSLRIAIAMCKKAFKEGVARAPLTSMVDMEGIVARSMYSPDYAPLVKQTVVNRNAYRLEMDRRDV